MVVSNTCSTCEHDLKYHTIRGYRTSRCYFPGCDCILEPIQVHANTPAPATLKAEWEPPSKPIDPKVLPGRWKPIETPHGVVYTNPEYDRNDEVVINDAGGKQSRVDYAFTELEPDMLLRVTQVLHKGKAEYGEKNWRQIPYEDHLNHIAYHWTQLHAGDVSEDHLANIICRAMFAMYMAKHD